MGNIWLHQGQIAFEELLQDAQTSAFISLCFLTLNASGVIVPKIPMAKKNKNIKPIDESSPNATTWGGGSW